jgi:hypothetical protein
MATFTASSLSRVMACPASEALPHVITKSSRSADRGTAAHEYLYRLHNGEPVGEALAAVPEEHRAYCESIKITPVPGAIAEVSVAYDVMRRRARLLGARGRSAYGALTPSEIAGTCDLFIPSSATVVDWKTTHDIDKLDVERYRPQLEFYALALARVHRLARIRYEIVAIDDAGLWQCVEQRELDFEDLEEIADRLESALRAVTSAIEHGPRKVVEGDHCRYCPAWRACPAKRAALEAIGGTPEPTGRTYLIVQDLERWAKLGRDVLREAVRANGTLPIDEQHVLGFDKRGALQVIKIKKEREP